MVAVKSIDWHGKIISEKDRYEANFLYPTSTNTKTETKGETSLYIINLGSKSR